MLHKFLKITATAIVTITMSTSAKADDPITNFLDTIFQPQHYQPMVKYRKGKRVQMVWDKTTVPEQDHPFRIRFPEYNSSVKWIASYYGAGEKLNSHTSNGERFNPHGFSAAHRSLPFGTKLHVCYRGCTVVRVNDRGPALWTGRSLDLSHGAAKAVGLTSPGVAPVSVTVLH